MKPVAVIPMNDPSGLFFPHLQAITPSLKTLFEAVFVSCNASTNAAVPEMVHWLAADDFFHTIIHPADPPIGEDFTQLFRQAAEASHSTQPMHLCFIDRVAFALQSEYKIPFMADVRQASVDQQALIFARSPLAWNTHPQNYRDAEQMVVTAGEWLLGKTLDFSWCHLVVQPEQLLRAVSAIQSNNISFFAEMILAIQDEVTIKEVDWLAWEDPFILGRNARELKAERESSLSETRKRMATAIAMLQHVCAAT